MYILIGRLGGEIVLRNSRARSIIIRMAYWKHLANQKAILLARSVVFHNSKPHALHVSTYGWARIIISGAKNNDRRQIVLGPPQSLCDRLWPQKNVDRSERAVTKPQWLSDRYRCIIYIYICVCTCLCRKALWLLDVCTHYNVYNCKYIYIYFLFILLSCS